MLDYNESFDMPPNLQYLIAKEIELGFLYIDSRARKLFPKGSGEIKVQLGSSNQIQSLTYNAKHHRIFGLVSWFRRNNLSFKSQIAISVEGRIKEIILLYGQGSLSVYKPVSDSKGIDLIVVKNGVFQPLFLQVKGRFKLHNDRTFISDVRMKMFNPHHSYFVVGAYFNKL